MALDSSHAVPATARRNEFGAASSEGIVMAQRAIPLPAARPAPGPVPVDTGRLRGRLALVAAVLAAVGLAVASLPGLDDVRERLTNVDAGWLAVAALLEAGSCAAFVVAFRGIMGRGLTWGLNARIGMAVQGANVLLPTGGAGGLAFSAWALSRTGMAARDIGRRTVTLFVATSSVNFLTAMAGGALVAAGLLSADVPGWLAAGPALAALAVILAVAQVPRLSDRAGARLGGRIAGATRRAVADGVRDALRLARAPRPDAVLGAAGYMFLDLAALTAAFAAVGDVPAAGVLLLAYPLGQLGGLIPVPGGIGGTDGALIAVFALYGSPLAVATAAVLAYRIFQLGLPAVLAAPAIGATMQAVGRPAGVTAPREPAPAAA